jgi:hypothetical protein
MPTRYSTAGGRDRDFDHRPGLRRAFNFSVVFDLRILIGTASLRNGAAPSSQE